jgi:hypothetical protein
LTFFYQGYSDPSSSLGYGFYIVGFWIISAMVLVILIIRNKLSINGFANKAGLFLATPIIFLLIIGTGLTTTDQVESEWYPYKDGHRYKFVTYSHRSSRATQRHEIYKSQHKITEDNTSFNSIKWLRDSTWTYFSEAGDTIKIEKYRKDKKME